MALPMRYAIRQRRALNHALRQVLTSRSNLCTAVAQPVGEKWHLVSAVCLERFPSISKQKTDMETNYQELLDKLEFEKSLLSDHELRHAEDLVVNERRKSEDYEETEADLNRVTALDLEDTWEADYRTFLSNNELTANCETDNMKSTNRDLDEKLTLIVSQKLGEDRHWILPQGLRTDEQSMRESAEQTLQSLCGDSIKAKFIGNAPCAFMKYRYPQSTEYAGAKVFFFKAHYMGGDIEVNNSDVSDYMWVKKKDLNKYVPEKYMNTLNDFILDI